MKLFYLCYSNFFTRKYTVGKLQLFYGTTLAVRTVCNTSMNMKAQLHTLFPLAGKSRLPPISHIFKNFEL